MESCCATFMPNLHVREGLDCVENGFWGKKIKPVTCHFGKTPRTKNRKIKKLGVNHSVLKSPIDEELLTFETPFFDERKVDPNGLEVLLCFFPLISQVSAQIIRNKSRSSSSDFLPPTFSREMKR